MNYADHLEALAELHQRSPLDVLEWFLEASDTREHEGMSRDYAEREALRDVEAQLEGRRL